MSRPTATRLAGIHVRAFAPSTRFPNGAVLLQWEAPDARGVVRPYTLLVPGPELDRLTDIFIQARAAIDAAKENR